MLRWVDREAALCRELTKTHETLRRDRLISALRSLSVPMLISSAARWSCLVEGFARADADIPPEAWAWLERLAEELPPRRAAAVVADVTGVAGQRPLPVAASSSAADSLELAGSEVDAGRLARELVRRSLPLCGRGKSGLQRVRAPGNAWGA